MSAGLPVADRTRLLQVLLLTGSNVDGEVMAAIKAAWRIASAHGMTLAEAVEASGRTVASQLDLKRLAALEHDAFERGRSAGRAEAGEWALPPWPVMRARALAEVPDLRPREAEFLRDIAQRRTLSPKQMDWLAAIYSRRVQP